MGNERFNRDNKDIPRDSILYSAQIQGLSSTFWSTIDGSPTDADPIVINAAEIDSFSQYIFGIFKFNFDIVTAPAGGQARIIGLQRPDSPTINAIYFEVTGTTFRAVSYDNDGNAETTDITWGDWEGGAVDYEIQWDNDNVIFLVDDVIYATHVVRVPDPVSLPLVIDNDVADALALHYVSADYCERISS